MIQNKKKFLMKLLVCFALLLAVVTLLISIFDMTYETNNPKKYLRIMGNIDNNQPRCFVYSFFPAEIQDNFSDVKYHYKSKYGDTYAYEVYLEFTIEDTAEYETFVSNTVNRSQCMPFEYDGTFYEHIIDDEYMIRKDERIKDSDSYILSRANMGRILFSDTEQCVIFSAIGMYDGGGAHCMDLGYFLERFNIEPRDLATDVW